MSVTATAADQRLAVILNGTFGQFNRGSDRLSQAAGNNLCGRVAAEMYLTAGAWVRAEYYMDLALTFEFGSSLAYFSINMVRPG